GWSTGLVWDETNGLSIGSKLSVGDTTTPSFVSATCDQGKAGYAPSAYPAGNSAVWGFASQADGDAAGNTDIRLLTFRNTMTGAANASYMSGVQGDTIYGATGTATLVEGLVATARLTAAGTINTAVASRGQIVLSAGTIATGVALRAQSPSRSGGTLSKAVGLQVDKQNGAGITKAYGILQADTGDLNQLAGRTTIGSAA